MTYPVRSLVLLLGFSAVCAAQGLLCNSAAVPVTVRVEGLSERMGDIVITCSGGAAGATVTGNLTLFQSVYITNRLSGDDRLDVSLTIDSGSGAAPANVPATQMSASSLVFNGLSFRLSAAGGAILRLSNLRGAAFQRGSADARTITVTIGFNGTPSLAFAQTQVTVGLTAPGLLASSSSATIFCVGSPLPEELNLAGLYKAGTRFHSTRVTEGWADAFQKRSPGLDIGTRVMARYSGLPAGARLFAPDYVAGSSAAQPTAGGDMGVPASGGRYAAGSGTMLLGRVRFTDPSGAAGAAPAMPGPLGATLAFDSVSEVEIQGGSALVVYEVLDSNSALQESAQWPTFLAVPRTGDGSTATARQEIMLAPVSTVATASSVDPIPRFAPVAPPSDCTALGDCRSSYFPSLLVDAPPLRFTASAGGYYVIEYFRVLNQGGGLLNWSISVNYKNGSGWLRIDPMSGLDGATVRVDALPEKLAPGLYEATLTVDAGAFAGSRTLAVTFTVTQPAPVPPAVRSVVNGASFQPAPVVPGSLATIFGSKLAGREVVVTLDGMAARVLFNSDTQINLLAPEGLLGRTSAQLVVRVDGISSAPQTVTVAAAAPAIFGTLNQDSSLNTLSNAAPVGTIVQIFATGLPLAQAGTILASVHDREAGVPIYGGPAPGLAGVQQVNLLIPDDLPAMTTDVRVCGVPAGAPAERICSPPSRITLR